MKPKSKILQTFSLEHNKDGILFIDTRIPIFIEIENLAKQLQMEVWLEAPVPTGNPKEYIR